MNSVKSYWDGLTRYQRWGILRRNHLWDGLINFDYKVIPEDVIKVLSREMDGNRSQKAN